jgi:cytochrome P450
MSDPTFQPQVMLPQEHIKWFMEQPEALVSHWSARQERHALEYLQIGVDFEDTTNFLTTIIANSLSPKRMGAIQPDMLDEIRKSVDRELGSGDNWTEFNVQDVMSRLISTVGSRVLFGFPLCRNTKFLHAVDKFILYMGIGTIVIGKSLHLQTEGRLLKLTYFQVNCHRS